MEPLGISIFQPQSRAETPTARLSWLDIAAERAAEKGSSLLICPELYMLGELSPKTLAERTEPVSGEYTERASEIAYLHDISLIFGYPEIDGDTLYNAAVCLSPEGAILANHRKSNLGTGAESVLFTAGGGISVFEQFGWKIALFHDGELELPDLAHAAAMAGAELFVVLAPPAHSRPLNSATLFATRAFENKAYLAYSSFDWTKGPHDHHGCSALFDPTGNVLSSAGNGQEMVSGQLQPNQVKLARLGIPYANDHRPFSETAL